jgi:large subunit ribosomal protein L3
MLGLIGKKIGMTQVFDKDGSLVPVTVVRAGPCTVVQKKTKDKDGYDAIQLGFGRRKTVRIPKARRVHCEKKNIEFLDTLREFRPAKIEDFEVGQVLTVSTFKEGDYVDVIGISKGHGFQGVIKRHGKHGGPMSHGSDFHRRTGSIGMRTWPGRVFKNTRLPGHMGDERVTTKNLLVTGVRPEDNVLLLKGAVPGSRNGIVVIINRMDDFENREGLTSKKGARVAKAQEDAEQKQEEVKEETAEKKE